MAVTYKFLPHYNFNDYMQWEGRWELIDGIPFSTLPMPEPLHQCISGNLGAAFLQAIRANGCSCKTYMPINYKLSADTVLNPDLLVVCKPITKDHLDFPPDIVAEILSEETEFMDRHIKHGKYEAAGIPYYLMVDAEAEAVEVYQLLDGRYTRQPLHQNQPFPFTLNDCRFEMVFSQIWD